MKKIKDIFGFIFSFQFSKLLIVFETLLVFILTKEGLSLARMCVEYQFTGSLPWVATMVTSAWAAYAVSAAFYYQKSGKEQIAKIEKFGVESPIDKIEMDKPTI